MDYHTQKKWDRAAGTFDIMAGRGPERRWALAKQEFFAAMREDANILFLALGTGLDIAYFPPRRQITAIDISPKMLEKAARRVRAYDGEIVVQLMDVHKMDFQKESFDQIFTSCTFCSVPDPVKGLRALYRVLKPGGELHMFEHTGSRLFPYNLMLHVMTLISSAFGPDMDRPTVDNARNAGFEIIRVHNLYLDVVKTIHARRPF